jgi:HNH endonuclease
MTKKTTYEDIKARVEARGLVFLTSKEDYTHTHGPLSVRCINCPNVRVTTLNNIVKPGAFGLCRSCVDARPKRHYEITYEDVKARVDHSGATLITPKDEYTGSHQQLTVLCHSCGATRVTNLYNISNRGSKGLCKSCQSAHAMQPQVLSYEKVKTRIEGVGLHLFTSKEDYIDTQHEITVSCSICPRRRTLKFHDVVKDSSKRRCMSCRTLSRPVGQEPDPRTVQGLDTRPVPGELFRDLICTNDGRIWSTNADLQRYLMLTISPVGYVLICHKGTTHRVHRLICAAFNPIDGYTTFGQYAHLQVNHKDGVKTNNRPDNLEWCTAQYNIDHSIATGLKPNISRGVVKHALEDVEYTHPLATYTSIKEASQTERITTSSIINGCRNKVQHPKKWRWRYAESE